MTVKEQIQRLERGQKALSRKLNRELAPIKAYIEAQPREDKKDSISISSEVWNVLKWLILIVGGLAGVNLL